MAESILVTGKKISSMELVTNVTGNEKIPTGQPDDLAVTPNQIADHTIARGDLASQEDLSQVEVSLGTQIADLESDVTSADNTIRGLIAAEEAARIAADSGLQIAIDAESLSRTDADAGLQSALDAEVSARITADDLKVDKEGSVSSVAGRVGDVSLVPSDVLVEGFGSQEVVNRYVDKPFLVGASYGVGERVRLGNGDVVKSTVPSNTVDPNVDMTGWVFIERYITPEQYGAIGDGVVDDTAALVRMFNEIPSGSVVFGTGVYKCSNVAITKNVTLEGGTYKSVMRTEISGRYHIPSLISSGGFDYIVGRNVKFTGEFVGGGGTAVTDNRVGQLFKFTGIRVVYFDNLELSNHASNWNSELDPYGHFAAVIDNCKFVRVKDLLIDNIRIEGFMVSNFDVYEIDGFRQINSDAIWTPLHSYSYSGSRLIAKNIFPKSGAGSTTNLKADNVYFERCRYLGGAGMDLGSEGDPSDVTYAELKDVEFHNCAFTIYTPEINGAGMKKLILNNVRNTNVGRGVRVIKCQEVVVNESDLGVVKRPDATEAQCYNFQIDDFEEIRINDTSLTGGYNCLSIPQRTAQVYSKKLIQLNNCKVDVNIATDTYANGKVIKLVNTNTAEADVVSVKRLSINGGSFSIANGNITGAYVGGGFDYSPVVENVDIFGKCVISYKTMTDARDWVLHRLKNFSITDGVKFINNGRQTNFLHGVTESLILEDTDFINDAVAPPSRFFFSPVLGCRKLRINGVGCYGALNSAESVIMANSSSVSYRADTHHNGNNYGVTTGLALNGVFASVSYDPPSIPANGTTETTVTLMGASVGSPVSVAFSRYDAGIEVSAIVSAAHTVLVKFKNTTGVAIDLPNGVISIKI